MKTYACKKAISASKNKISVTTNQTNILDPTINGLIVVIIAHENPIKIFSNAWPDIMLANNLILKLNTFAKYEISSITTKKGAIKRGTPLGKNKFTKCHASLCTPMTFIPIKCVAAKKNVTIKLLVIVNI